MRFRLLRRRLTISAPRVAIRSAMPWPLRWAMAAIVLGFCGAIGLWAFEFGRGIAGLDTHSKSEFDTLKSQVAQLRSERDQALSVNNTSGSLLTAAQAAQEKLASQVRQLEADNAALRDDLGFFEKLIPSSGADSLAIRGLQAEALGVGESGAPQVRWQVLVMQAVRNAPTFNGRLEVSFSGLQDGKPWSMALPDGAQPLQLRQYRRLQGVVDVPAGVVVQNVSVKVLDGAVVRAQQMLKL